MSPLRFGLGVLLTLLSGCALSGPTVVSLSENPQARGYVLVERPMILPRGKVVYDCGPEALTCVLNYWGYAASVDEATRVLYNPRLRGTLSFDLAPYARTKGFATRYDNGSIGKIREAVQKQIPPIIMIDASGMFPMVTGTFYHFFVVTGYHDEERIILCENYDATKKYSLSYDDLEQRWSRTQFFYLEIYPASAYETFRTAQELEARGEYRQAQEMYRQTIEKDPSYQPAHLGLGNTYLLSGDTRGAREHYEKAFQLDPYDPVAMNNLAHVLMELRENLDQAETLVNKALDGYRFRLKTLEAKLKLEEDEPARKEIQREWTTIRRQYALSHGTLGQVEYIRDKIPEAIATWELALSVTPESDVEVKARRYFELGRAYRNQGMQDKSRDYLRTASEKTQDPELQSAIRKALSE